MPDREVIRDWFFVMLRPICISDEHCEAYVSDLFRGLSERGVVIKSREWCDETDHFCIAIEPLIKED